MGGGDQTEVNRIFDRYKIIGRGAIADQRQITETDGWTIFVLFDFLFSSATFKFMVRN